MQMSYTVNAAKSFYAEPHRVVVQRDPEAEMRAILDTIWENCDWYRFDQKEDDFDNGFKPSFIKEQLDYLHGYHMSETHIRSRVYYNKYYKRYLKYFYGKGGNIIGCYVDLHKILVEENGLQDLEKYIQTYYPHASVRIISEVKNKEAQYQALIQEFDCHKHIHLYGKAGEFIYKVDDKYLIIYQDSLSPYSSALDGLLRDKAKEWLKARFFAGYFELL